MAGFTLNNALMGALQPTQQRQKAPQRNGFSFGQPTSTGVGEVMPGVRSVSMDPHDVAVRAVEAKNGLGFTANPTDINRFAIPLPRGIGNDDSMEIPQWLLDQAKPFAGRTGFSLAGPEALGVHAQPGATGDTTYKVGNQIFSGTHTGGFAADANTDVARRFNPDSFVSYADSPEYRQALATGKWTLLNGTPYNVLDRTGKVIGTKKFEGLEDEDNMDMIALALTGAAIGGMGLTAAGGGAGAGAAGGAGGAGGSTGAATGAGVTGFGDAGAMYAGLDAGAAGTLGGGGSFAGAGLGATAVGAGAGAGGGAGGGGFGAGATTAGKVAGSMAGGFDWGSLIGPGLNALGGIFGSKAAGDAADAQLQAAREAMALQEPFRQGGMKGLNRLLELLGLGGNKKAPDFGSAAKSFGMEDFQADPGFQFRQDEGLKALERSAAARGGLLSGGAMKDALRFSQGIASDEFGNAFNRFQAERAAKLNPLQSLMGAGQTSANTIGDLTTQAGNAQAAGIVGRTNAITNGIAQGVSMYNNQQQANASNALLERILAGRGI